jgi:hypothetical protein
MSYVHLMVRRYDLPTLTGLILMASSACAVSGLSDILCANTSDSHSVLTKVVRPVPDAPVFFLKGKDEATTPVSEELTDYHDGELDTLLDLVSPASCRHVGNVL